jgi:hypothetical protein
MKRAHKPSPEQALLAAIFGDEDYYRAELIRHLRSICDVLPALPNSSRTGLRIANSYSSTTCLCARWSKLALVSEVDPRSRS